MTDKPQAHAIVITVIGALPAGAFPHDQLREFMARLEQALKEAMPDFLPAYPPITITEAELRDDWIKTKKAE